MMNGIPDCVIGYTSGESAWFSGDALTGLFRTRCLSGLAVEYVFEGDFKSAEDSGFNGPLL